MAYEPRTFQSVTANTPPTGTDPMVDNTASGDVQAIKLINPTAGSVAPWIAQAARAQSLPVALSTEDAALLADLLTITAFQARTPALGQATAANSSPVVLASDQSAIPVTLTSTTIGAALPAGNNNIGDVDIASIAAGDNNIGNVDIVTVPADPFGANADAAVVTDTTGTFSGKLRGLVKWAFERMPASLGQKAMAASLPIVIASDQSAVPVSGTITASGNIGLTTGAKTFTTAAPTNSAASMLAANASRKTAIIQNNGSMTVYLGVSSGVTTSNGLPLAPGASLIDDRTTDVWFGIVASGTGDLRILEVA